MKNYEKQFGINMDSYIYQPKKKGLNKSTSSINMAN